MKTYKLKGLSDEERNALVRRPALDFDDITKVVQSILDDVKQNGDLALTDYTLAFDGVKLDNFRISGRDVENAVGSISEADKEIFRQAYRNIRKFHESQMIKESPVETMSGVVCFRESRAIDAVGFYIPGGTAVLPSTVLMLGIPAQLAGVRKIVMCTPPGGKVKGGAGAGDLTPEVLYCAKLVGITDIFKVGGAQAVAAMAYGTESVPKVNKIFGPGNRYVTAAKMLVSVESEGPAIDMPAGPSELLVIADKYANPVYVAADLLSQAEHGVDSQVVLVTDSERLLKDVVIKIKKQSKKLSRIDIVEKSLESSLLILADDIEQALEFSNSYAPEHLILNVKNSRNYVEKIQNAGSVFLGEFSPESVGDYASGTNHTLPTYGYARSYSGVSVDSFLKKITFQELSEKGLEKIAPIVERMAEIESLDAHKNAVSVRLNS